MKNTFLNTHKKLSASSLFSFVDRDTGQIDLYKERPAVKFPCVLIKVNQVKRDNLNPMMQRVHETIQIRGAFERTIGQSNLQDAQRLEKALEYYDAIEAVMSLFQGLKLGDTDKWICTSAIDEDRPDFDVVKITFTTTRIEEF
ncbi:hypothetical protein [Sphingobacterium siyangense]|uniref:hypothetical protein n=1 Tax=Sphingobacterium siyangense TaxID=459529 RepID=UPI00301796AC